MLEKIETSFTGKPRDEVEIGSDRMLRDSSIAIAIGSRASPSRSHSAAAAAVPLATTLV